MIKKIGRIFLGILMILVGIVGFIFPIIPGFVFFFPGVALLFPEIPYSGRFICWMMAKFPSSRKATTRVKQICKWMEMELPECMRQSET